MDYVEIYTGMPTGGGKDGIKVSTNGSETEPIYCLLKAHREEKSRVICALRMSDKCEQPEPLTITIEGGEGFVKIADGMQLFEESFPDKEFKDSITIPEYSLYGGINHCFTLLFTSKDDEKAHLDKLNLHVTGKIQVG